LPANCKPNACARWTAATGLLFALVLSPACSKKAFDDTPATIEPAQAAPSPPLTSNPAGSVRPLSGRPQSALFDGRTGLLAVVSPGFDSTAPASVTVLGSQQTSQRVIELPGPATGLAGDNNGTAYLSTRGGYLVVDLPTGHVTTRNVRDSEHLVFSAISRRSDGTVVLGTADGLLYLLAAGATDGNRIQVHAHVDRLAAQGNTVAVLDRGQTSITTVGPDGRIGQSLRAGQGATTMSADPAGRLLVSDTRGDQLLVYGVDPLILRQAYPVADSPYGVAGSRGLAWVSQTSANTVTGYDLSTGIPLEKVRYRSVRQPNALAFDDVAGTLYVVSGTGEGVQIIEHAAAGLR
jgi:hypothetical protein